MRVTGSGLGCPTWPECTDGSITPTVEQAEGFHKYIEFGNRTLTGVLLVLALATVLVVWRWAPRRAMKVAAGRSCSVGVIGQAVLGGITVLLGLQPGHRGRPLPGVDGAWSRRRPTSGSPGTRGPGRRAPLVAPLVTRLGWVTVAVGAAVLAARHRRHRLRPALRRRRRAQPVRVRPAHRLVAARRPGHDLHRPGRRHLARGPAHRGRRRARPGAGLAGRARRLARAGTDRLRAVLHRPARGARHRAHARGQPARGGADPRHPRAAPPRRVPTS